MSTWLYQFWFFSYKTSKYWGQGPRHWTADSLGFSRSETANFPTPDSQESPGTFESHLAQVNSPAAGSSSTAVRTERIAATTESPSQLCRWSIHVEEPEYTAIPDSPRDTERFVALSDPTTYKPWSSSELSNASHTETLRDALESNDFSSINSDRIPLAVPQVLQTASREQEDLRPESIAFAIMSRNVDLLEKQLAPFAEDDDDADGLCEAIKPFHLAAAYLDGSKSCCLILNAISAQVLLRRTHYINSLGHTVLDALMITIIKSHTSCQPESVDSAFRGARRFPGEEMDICGRWDADSDCVRALLSKGKHRVPFNWKHKFCHTSVQAVCDAIATIWGYDSAPDINTLSGLFVRRCTSCGLKMQLTPLHTCVLVMFQLSYHGCKDEDLFGMVAVLLYLLHYGADPRISCPVAVMSFFQVDETSRVELDINGCQHEIFDPLQFAESIFQTGHSLFAPSATPGWHVCMEILSHSQRNWQASDVELARREDENECDYDSSMLPSPGCPERCRYLDRPFDAKLGLIWAAVKSELATYRRISTSDSWTSQYIGLKPILLSLQNDSDHDIPLVKQNMMKPICRCGAFLSDWSECISPGVACKFYFSNMEDWFRSSFSPISSREWGDWLLEEGFASNDTDVEKSKARDVDSTPSNNVPKASNTGPGESTAQVSGQDADMPDQPGEPSELGPPQPQQDVNIYNPLPYEIDSPWWMRDIEGQGGSFDMYHGDTEMYDAE